MLQKSRRLLWSGLDDYSPLFFELLNIFARFVLPSDAPLEGLFLLRVTICPNLGSALV